MNELMDQGLTQPPHPSRQRIQNGNGYSASIIMRDLPSLVRQGDLTTCRLYLENTGHEAWYAKAIAGRRRTSLFVYLDGELQQIANLRFDVHPGERGHFVFELQCPVTSRDVPAQLRTRGNRFEERRSASGSFVAGGDRGRQRLRRLLCSEESSHSITASRI